MARELEIVVTAEVAAAVSQLNKVLQSVQGVEKAADAADKSVGGLDTAMKTGGSTAGKFDTSLGSMGSTLGKIGGLVAVGAVLNKGFDMLVGGIKAVGGVALDMNSSLEKSTLQFTTLMGDSARAEAHVKSLFEFAKRTPFETGPIITASKHLQLFGGDALNTTKNLQMLGDASAASGANFEEVAFWTGRMYASLQAGKPVGEAMMRLMELGVVTPKARNAIENLAASAGGGTKAFEAFQASLGQFAGAMNLQANTFEGLSSTISDAVKLTIADSLKPFFDLIKSGAQIVAQVLGSSGMQKTFEQVGAGIKASLGPNSAAQVKTLLLAFVGFGEGIVTVVDIATRAFYALKLTIAIILQAVVEFTNAQINLIAGLTDIAASLPGVGRAFEGVNRELQDQKLFMQGATEEARRQTAAAYDGVTGNSAFGKALDGARTVMQTMRVEIGRATVAQQQQVVTTAQATGALDAYTASAGLSAKEIAKAQKAQEKFEKDMRKFESFASGTAAKTFKTVFQFDTDPMIKAQDAINKFQASVTSFSAAGSKAWGQFAQTVEQQSSAVRMRFDGVGKAFSALPQTIIGALQGGGNVLKSAGASLGAGLASDLASTLGSKLPGFFGGALSAAAGPLGSIVGSLAGTLVGKLFGPSQQQQVDDLRNKFLQAGGGLQAMQERADLAGVSMAGLFNVKRPQDFEAAVKAFNQQLADSEKRTQDTRAAMERWGLTIEQMGPKFATQELNSKLLSIVKDMELLTSAGADFNVVAAKMAPEINKLVQSAITAGGTVPREMQPILQKMFDLGLLTDSSGNKLEEFGQIPFATDLNQQFAQLISKMDALLSKLFGMEDSLNESKNIAGQIVDTVQNIEPPSWFNTVPGFDRGGMVGRDFRAPSLRDTIPAMLRPGEVVLTPEQVRAGEGPTGGGSSSVVNVSINVAGYLDSPSARTGLANIVRDELSKTLRRTGRAA